ncbi:MAG: iron ABC transporter permease [Lachnospiraceae bacterium]|nr:iron ABC transporter permease [Lachnospiraceae bacterium]
MKRNKMMLLAFLTAAAFLLCIGAGAVAITPADMLELFMGGGKASFRNILLHVRIPRVIACGLAGAGLASAGVLIQNVLQNPLASPNIIGVNAGAGLGVVLCSALFPMSYYMVPAAAFAGALGATLFIFLLAKKTGASRMTLILAGVCANSFLNAAADVVHTLQEDTLTGTYAFRLGGFTSVTGRILLPAGVLIVLVILLVCLLSDELEVLSLGEPVAKGIGLSVGRYQFLFLVLASALAGASVSFAGLLGFVGLIAPHIARRLVGEECRYLLPFSALFGAFFVMVCDLAARTLFAPYEIPTGIILSFVGAPFFLWLLFQGNGRRNGDGM